MSPSPSAPQGNNAAIPHQARVPSQSHGQSHRTSILPPVHITPIPIPLPRTHMSPSRPNTKPTTSHSQVHSQSQTTSQPATATPPVIRPIVSPLTPPQAKAQLTKQSSPNFAQGRPVLTHSQPPQTTIPPPALQPLNLESNPDAIALRSAIAILQNQRARALRDIQTLQKAKDEAINYPEIFVADLQNGKVHIAGNSGLLATSTPAVSSAEVSSDSSSEEDAPPAESSQVGLEKLRRRQERSRRRAERAARKTAGAPWTNLPGPQNVVRCPPINWSKYAVVGESLDKIHAEQLTRPPTGTPAMVGLTGRFEFKAGGRSEVGPANEYFGVAAPYNPGQDQVSKKLKGKR